LRINKPTKVHQRRHTDDPFQERIPLAERIIAFLFEGLWMVIQWAVLPSCFSVAKDNTYDKIILGIDPGTSISGYGVIGVIQKELHLISMGIIDLRKEANHALKLQRIYDRCSKLIEIYLPDEFAIEAPFYGKNPQSMLKLGRAQGVSMAAALNQRIPIFEYAPRRVKQSITGSGNASKEQVAAMVNTLLNNKTQHSKLDATDAVAIAICHYFTYKPGLGSDTKNYGSWKAFIADNKDKLR
jgi:crossover junction endodeoxyribonuclease RuvC